MPQSPSTGLFLRKADIKGTGSPDGLGFSWHIWIDLGLKKGRGRFLNLLGAPSLIHWNTRISCSKCDCELAYKVSYLFLSVPANHRLSILSKVDWLTAGVLQRELAHCLQILPAHEKLGLEAHEIAQKNPADNRMQRKLQDH
jgi:hypothetical protein